MRGFPELTTGTKHEWLHPFIIIPIIGLVFGYSLLGSNRLIMKTMGEFQNKFYKLSNILQYTMVLFILLVAIFSPMVDNTLNQIWFHSQYSKYFVGVVLLSFILLWLHRHSLKLHQELTPFWYGAGLFLLSFVGLVASVFPYLVPRQITYIEAAAPNSSLLFMGVGALICIIPLLAYTGYSYYVFRGKIKTPIGY